MSDYESKIMDIAATTGTTSASTGTSTAALTSDFQTFLKLMTTQLQEQDPLSPMDSTEYLSQLASFSTVEQQTLTNKYLESLNLSMGALGMVQVASWVGNEARAAMPALVEGGADITLSPQVAEGADRAVLVVKDAEGTVVSRVDLPVAGGDFTWSPQDMTGTDLPDGLYTLTVENYTDGEQGEDTAVELYGRITEVQGISGDMELLFEGGRKVSVSNVTAIRA